MTANLEAKKRYLAWIDEWDKQLQQEERDASKKEAYDRAYWNQQARIILWSARVHFLIEYADLEKP